MTFRTFSTLNKLKKADFALILICVMASIFSFVLFWEKDSALKYIRISYDGDVIQTIPFDATSAENREVYVLLKKENNQIMYSLSEEYPYIAEFDYYNIIRLSDNSVSIVEADCPDKICVQHKPISRTGESIICLPHHFVVDIYGNNDQSDQEIDGMVK